MKTKKEANGSIQKNKKRFSIKWKLTLMFGGMIMLFLGLLGAPAIRIAKSIVLNEAEEKLMEKSHDVAKIIALDLEANFRQLETIAQMEMFKDMSISYIDKAKRLDKAKKVAGYIGLYIIDSKGFVHFSDGKTLDASGKDYFKIPMQGKRYESEPYTNPVGDFCIETSCPIYDDNKNKSRKNRLCFYTW